MQHERREITRAPEADLVHVVTDGLDTVVPMQENDEAVPACPECAGGLSFDGFFLCSRDEDGKRVCRVLWNCTADHRWWGWADRPGEPLEIFPYDKP